MGKRTLFRKVRFESASLSSCRWSFQDLGTEMFCLGLFLRLCRFGYRLTSLRPSPPTLSPSTPSGSFTGIWGKIACALHPVHVLAAAAAAQDGWEEWGGAAHCTVENRIKWCPMHAYRHVPTRADFITAISAGKVLLRCGDKKESLALVDGKVHLPTVESQMEPRLCSTTPKSLCLRGTTLRPWRSS